MILIKIKKYYFIVYKIKEELQQYYISIRIKNRYLKSFILLIYGFLCSILSNFRFVYYYILM